MIDSKKLNALKSALPGGEGRPEVLATADGVELKYATVEHYSARTSRDMEAIGKAKDLAILSSETVEPNGDPQLTGGSTHYSVRVRLGA